MILLPYFTTLKGARPLSFITFYVRENSGLRSVAGTKPHVSIGAHTLICVNLKGKYLTI
jgi:hypothetical protein